MPSGGLRWLLLSGQMCYTILIVRNSESYPEQRKLPMRIGLVEFILILFIASVTVGPQVALFVDRWLRRANRASALAARRKAQAQAQMVLEREALLHRFRVASNVFAVLAALALVYALVFRPIATPPRTYTPVETAPRSGTARAADAADALDLNAYEMGSALRVQDGWVYAAATLPKAGVLLRMQPDGTSRTEVLDLSGCLLAFCAWSRQFVYTCKLK